MKLLFIKTGLFFIFIFAVVFMLDTSPVWANHSTGMSPREGHIKTTTGAPVANIRVVEYSDWCPPRNLNEVSCGVPDNCHVERSVITDANGYYYFEPWTPPVNPNDQCNLNAWWMYTCWNPSVFLKVDTSSAQAASFNIVPAAHAQEEDELICPPVQHPTTNVVESINTDITCSTPPACNVTCERDDQCAGAKDGCTTCLGGVCRPPQACNSSCTDSSECARAEGCTECLPNDEGTGNVCRPAPACNVGCTRDDQCTGSRDGCTSCVPNDSGTGSVCAPPPACNVGCTRDDQCAGSKDGCTTCAPNTAGKNVCQPPFDSNACKCDGFNALNLQNPSNSNFQFEAFAKVEGQNTSSAQVTNMKFVLYKSSKSDPNNASQVATGTIVPEIVSSTAEKVRYRAVWSVPPPAYDPDAIYRVGAEPTCARKPASASGSASLNFSATDALLSSDNSSVLGTELNYTPAVLAQSNDNLQLGTLEDGYFTRIVETDSCRFIRFEYGQY